MHKVYIILLNFNNPQLTIDCVESIKKSTYNNFSIIIVDNASTDNSFDILTTNYENDSAIHLIKSKENSGFSAGNNIGINFALKKGADYVMLLNNDTVIDKDMISTLLLKANENTVTVPKMYYYSKPNIIWYAGGDIDYKIGKITHIGINQKDSIEYFQENNCLFATGCCLLIHKSIINKVGLLDESYFLYCEDVDYSLRLTQNDINILFVPTAKLWHKVGSSSSSNKNVIYYNTRNTLYIMDKCDFSLFSKIKYRIKIMLLFVRGILTNSNDKLFGKAYVDYKKSILGKTDI